MENTKRYAVQVGWTFDDDGRNVSDIRTFGTFEEARAVANEHYERTREILSITIETASLCASAR